MGPYACSSDWTRRLEGHAPKAEFTLVLLAGIGYQNRATAKLELGWKSGVVSGRGSTMKRIGLLSVLVIVLGLSASVAAQDSLADAARHSRQAKKANSAKVYTNDNFAPVPQAPAVTTSDPGDKTAKAEKSESDPAKAKTDDKEKLAASFKSKADEQK